MLEGYIITRCSFPLLLSTPGNLYLQYFTLVLHITQRVLTFDECVTWVINLSLLASKRYSCYFSLCLVHVSYHNRTDSDKQSKRKPG